MTKARIHQICVCVIQVVISRSYVDISTDYRQINRIIDLIHSLSGGNPLYCRDLATSVVRSSSSLAVAQEHLEELKRNFKPDNMDELICYSLDQLALHLQAILKFASVAGVRGACFCAEDLMVLVKASSSSHADTVEEVSEMLASIRSECGFLQLLGKDELDPKAFFQFSNTVYQRLLYGLILKDTKISLHKVRVTIYKSPYITLRIQLTIYISPYTYHHIQLTIYKPYIYTIYKRYISGVRRVSRIVAHRANARCHNLGYRYNCSTAASDSFDAHSCRFLCISTSLLSFSASLHFPFCGVLN